MKAEWYLAELPSKVKELKQHPRKNKAAIQFERLKASLRAKVGTRSGSSNASLAS